MRLSASRRFSWWWAGLLLLSGMAVRADEPAGDSLHWSYRPIVRPALPAVRQKQLVQTPIDAFVLARLEEQGLSFTAEATREELLRRLKFDLHGLPPTAAERAEFLADQGPEAYERLVDRLLDSPHYGERWGRMWLDVVRFAETAGYNADPLRPLAYKYRDYVIRSFNRDTPYDRFVQEQLAGDELFPEDIEALIGVGFNRLPPDESNASNVHLARQDQLNDLTTAVGAIFLGQSLGCAQCHDHKFDDISQRDFYRIQAFFAGIVPVEEMPVGAPDELARYQDQVTAWRNELTPLQDELQTLEKAARDEAGADKRIKFPADVLAAIDTLPSQRDAMQQQLCFFAERQIDIPDKEIDKRLSEEQRKRRKELQQQIARVSGRKPQPAHHVAATTTVDGPNTPTTFLLAGGSYDKPLDEVQPGFLHVIAGENAATISPPRPGTVGRRSALAHWLTDPANPLPARVFVNRVWQGHLGKGIVENANDLGVQTPAPSHPELLDWLASEFVAQGWSIKQLHRLILRSAVYRQGTRPAAELATAGEQADPGNTLYWHFERRRVDAEALRDALLTASGLLDQTMFGPGVKPELPPGMERGWTPSADLTERQRRSVYILAKRNLPYPFLKTFDLPDTFESCACRQMTTTGPQALMLLNSDLVLRAARSLAGRILREHPSQPLRDTIREVYLATVGREPLADEIEVAADFVRKQAGVIEQRLRQQEHVALPTPFPKFQSPAEGAALVDLCHALFNANEFLYVD